MNSLLELAKTLIIFPTESTNTPALHQIISYCKEFLKTYSVEEFESNGIPSLLAYNTPTKPEKFKIILNAHLDVIPGTKAQFTPVEKDGKLYGRGAYDMKAAAAAMMLAFTETARTAKYPIGLQLVTDEEPAAYDGTYYQLHNGVDTEFAIIGEPSNMGIANQLKGLWRVEIIVRGKVGHSAYVWKGKNAIWDMSELLEKIRRKFPIPTEEVWESTINVAYIESNNKTINVIPDECKIGLDVRYIAGDKERLEKELRSLLPENAELIVLNEGKAHNVAENNPFLLQLKTSYEHILQTPPPLVNRHGSGDIRHFNQAIEFGPIGSGMHADEEWVDLRSLTEYYRILKDFLTSLS